MSKEKLTDKPAFWVGASILTLGVGYFAYRKISKAVEVAKENKGATDINKIGKKDPREAYASTYAQRLYAAFFPYVGGWWSWIPDGTDVPEVMKVASEMKSNKVLFSMVSKAYKNLHQRTLTDDLVDELSAQDLTRFYQIIGVPMNGIPQQLNILSLI